MSDLRAVIMRNDDDKSRVIAWLQRLQIIKPLQLTIERYVARRRSTQNRLYFAWLKLIADETGHSSEELHHFFKMKFLPRIVVTIGDVEDEVPSSSAKLSTSDFSEYLNRIDEFVGSNLGLMLPHPEEAGEWQLGRAA